MADICLDLIRCHTVPPYACAASYEPGSVLPGKMTQITHLEDMYFTGDHESSFFDRHESTMYDCPRDTHCHQVHLGKLMPMSWEQRQEKPMRGHWRITVEFIPAVERPSGVCLPPSKFPSPDWHGCLPMLYTDDDDEGEPPRERCLRREDFVGNGPADVQPQGDE